MLSEMIEGVDRGKQEKLHEHGIWGKHVKKLYPDNLCLKKQRHKHVCFIQKLSAMKTKKAGQNKDHVSVLFLKWLFIFTSILITLAALGIATQWGSITH